MIFEQISESYRTKVYLFLEDFGKARCFPLQNPRVKLGGYHGNDTRDQSARFVFVFKGFVCLFVCFCCRYDVHEQNHNFTTTRMNIIQVLLEICV